MFCSLAIADGSWYEFFSLLYILAGVMQPLTTNIFECVNLKIQIRIKLGFSAIYNFFYSPLKWHKSQMVRYVMFFVRYVTQPKKKKFFVLFLNNKLKVGVAVECSLLPRKITQ